MVGRIPTEVGRLINLTWLDLNKNQLTGKGPISKNSANGRPVYHMTFLMMLCILVGSIPTEIGKLINLEELHLDKNKLTGERPISKISSNGRPVYHMPFLITSCIPVGSIPTEIARLINLTRLDLDDNQLTGKRPIRKISANGRPVYHMTFLMMSYILVGRLPTELGRLINLENLDLSFNRLTGKRPISKNSATGRPVYNMRFLMTCSCFV